MQQNIMNIWLTKSQEDIYVYIYIYESVFISFTLFLMHCVFQFCVLFSFPGSAKHSFI